MFCIVILFPSFAEMTLSQQHLHSMGLDTLPANLDVLNWGGGGGGGAQNNFARGARAFFWV